MIVFAAYCKEPSSFLEEQQRFDEADWPTFSPHVRIEIVFCRDASPQGVVQIDDDQFDRLQLPQNLQVIRQVMPECCAVGGLKTQAVISLDA